MLETLMNVYIGRRPLISMNFLGNIISTIILVLIAGLGVFGLLKPHALVEWLRRQPRKSRWSINPFLFKPWYPMFLRFMGIVALAFVVLSLMAIANRGL